MADDPRPRGRWNVPYFSPIYVELVTPRKTGRRILHIRFINAFYAQNVQDFELDLEIIKHTPGYLVANLVGSEDRCAVISQIEFGWIEQFCPSLWSEHPPHSLGSAAAGSASMYMHAVFRTGYYSPRSQ